MKPPPLVYAFLVRIKICLRAKFLLTDPTLKPDSIVNVFSVFHQAGLCSELAITLGTSVSHLLVIALDVES